MSYPYKLEKVEYTAGVHSDVIDAQYKRNWSIIREADKKAKKTGELIGRYIKHPYADGAAFYVISAVKGRRVLIEVLCGIGDDWVLPAWGEKCWIAKAQAEDFLGQRDALEELFLGKKYG